MPKFIKNDKIHNPALKRCRCATCLNKSKMGRYARNNAAKKKKREQKKKKKIMEIDRSISFIKNGIRSERKKNLSSVMTGKNSALIERELEQVYEHIGATKNSAIEINGKKIISKFITVDLNAGLNLGFMPTRKILREGYVPFDKYCHGNAKGVKVYSYDDLLMVQGKANVVMSDMAASSSGHKKTDHLRIMALCETAAYFAFDVLEEGGTFVAKVLAGGAESDLQTLLKQKFKKVYNVKPPSSRSDSSEKFVVALGFRG